MNTVEHQFLQLETLINNAYGESKVVFETEALASESVQFTGCNGALCVVPLEDGYAISLAGESLVEALTEPLNQLLGSAVSSEQGTLWLDEIDSPSQWYVSEFGMVQAAVLKYAQTDE